MSAREAERSAAYAGKRDEAVAEGQRGVAMVPIEKDGETGPYYVHQLTRIYLHTGQPEKALDQLEKLMAVPYYLSPAWLRIDPEFSPLKGNPRFAAVTTHLTLHRYIRTVRRRATSRGTPPALGSRRHQE